ncbi:hypothetical protein [Natrinema sp. 1APR25-10V2]|uniref:DUF7344 domain-containing protein n=1 Tax=Natrinema sp. 1APR25-10V2 TaxID=2951081 RepID=UPI0028748E0C|nr:hypothetical protein [Natrinema sp. 1APR25-10V2]MDS0476887.1 hypothetical protein [Natrinema sp. 1APR25-10V2]
MTDNNSNKTNITDNNMSISDGGQQERFNEILTALADTHRRYVLYYLQDEEQASLTETAKHVAAWKQDCPPTEIQDKRIENFEIQLYHNHLPLLEEMCLVEYDDRSEQLVFRDPPELVDLCLDHCTDQDLHS